MMLTASASPVVEGQRIHWWATMEVTIERGDDSQATSSGRSLLKRATKGSPGPIAGGLDHGTGYLLRAIGIPPFVALLAGSLPRAEDLASSRRRVKNYILA